MSFVLLNFTNVKSTLIIELNKFNKIKAKKITSELHAAFTKKSWLLTSVIALMHSFSMFAH
jgi:hypothetical protein